VGVGVAVGVKVGVGEALAVVATTPLAVDGPTWVTAVAAGGVGSALVVAAGVVGSDSQVMPPSAINISSTTSSVDFGTLAFRRSNRSPKSSSRATLISA